MKYEEKRKKIKRLYVRIDDNIYDKLNKYIEKNNISKNKLIEDFLKDLLKDEIKN